MASEDYNEQRAKARYIKLRVRALRQEHADIIHQERLRAREEKRQNKERAMDLALQNLEQRADSLVELKKTRARIRTMGFWLPFVLGTAIAITFLRDESTGVLDHVFIGIGLGLLAGLTGFATGEIIRWLMPTQHRLAKEETALEVDHKQLEWAHMSWFGRIATTLFQLAIGLVVICYVVYRVVEHFASNAV